MPEPLVATNFRFRVALVRATGPSTSPARLGTGGFQECSGLDIELELDEYKEGGRNDGVSLRLGRAKFARLVLKRGIFHSLGEKTNPEMWRWILDVVEGVRPVRRYNGTVEVLGLNLAVVSRWSFTRALPAKVVGPQLNARTGDVAIEELHLAHEGLKLGAP